MDKRRYSFLDKLLMQANDCLSTVASQVRAARDNPANHLEDAELSSEETTKSAGFMRVNHTGEVCAQALYRGQALVARNPSVQKTLITCCDEETDHLAWCHDRLEELNSHRSYLNTFWYWNSFAIGVIAGLAGDKWSLGFVEETEIQVGKHLEGHLETLPAQDQKSRIIVAKMQEDELKHAETANEQGAAELPSLIKKIMAMQATVMTTLAYRI